MKDDSNRYKNLDEKFRLAAAEIPVEFNASAWEALSQQLDNVSGTSGGGSSNTGTTNGGSSNWLGGFNLNTVIGLIIESITFMTLVTVIIPSALAISQGPELIIPDAIIEAIPVQEVVSDKDSTFTIPKQIDLVKETKKPKEILAPILEIKKDTVTQKHDSIQADSLFIFW